MKSSNENISQLLRNVDAVIKAGKLEDALGIIETILEINPKNIYAKAYNERIEELLKEKRKNTSSTSPSVAREQPVSGSIPNDGGSPADKTSPSKVDQKLSEAFLEAYKTLLHEIWKDGHITPLEQERINTMQNFFAITPDEHDYLEQNARLTCYLNAIRDNWNDGKRDFSKVKNDFKITEQENLVLQPKVERLIKSLSSKGVILSLDDDKTFLLLVERLLEKHGYHCLNTTSGEEALLLLENFVPDLVLCDIAFGQKNMNGFMFYEQFRAMERFASVPFIFISGLDQKELIKKGKKIGVDDYLTKPVDNDVLMAAIEGRIRRSREIKKTSEY